MVEGKKRTTFSFDILPYPHCGEFTISPFHYMNWFTISPFHHSIFVPFQHFTIPICLSYTILPNNFSYRLTHPLYQYYILTDHLSNYSESDESHVNRSTPKYANIAREYETPLHITPDLLYNFLNKKSSRSNFYGRSMFLGDFVAVKMPLSRTIAPQGGLCVRLK